MASSLAGKPFLLLRPFQNFFLHAACSFEPLYPPWEYGNTQSHMEFICSNLYGFFRIDGYVIRFAWQGWAKTGKNTAFRDKSPFFRSIISGAWRGASVFRCARLKNGGEASIMRKRKDKTNTSDSVAVVIDEEFRRKFSDYCLMDDYYMFLEACPQSFPSCCSPFRTGTRGPCGLPLGIGNTQSIPDSLGERSDSESLRILSEMLPGKPPVFFRSLDMV